MAKRLGKIKKANDELQEFAIVTLAEDPEQAKEYETLLKANDIPAVIKEQQEDSTNVKGIAIMVPEDFLDEAHVIIESQDAYDDFYDFTSEDKGGDFDDDVFDDEF